jgi:hypothetical protein
MTAQLNSLASARTGAPTMITSGSLRLAETISASAVSAASSSASWKKRSSLA